MEAAAYDEMRALEDRHWWFRARRARLAPLMREAVEAARARTSLDIGCGTGANLAQAEQLFPALRRIGLDREPGALAYCAGRSLHALLACADGTRLPLRDGSIDCVFAFDIIEHFERDDLLLAELRRVLRPGGQLVASVPSFPWLWSPHDEFLHHKRRYRRGELERKLRAAGFRVERRRAFNFLLLPPIALVRLARRWSGARERAAHETSSDFFELPRAFDLGFAALFALEGALVRVLPITSGVSLHVRASRS